MNEVLTNQKNIELMITIGVYVIGSLLTAMGVIFTMYMAWQVRIFKRLEDIDIATQDTANELKARLETHIGDATHRHEIIRDRLSKLEITVGATDEGGHAYLRRAYDPPRTDTPPKRRKPPS
jgi:hypothetical protein